MKPRLHWLDTEGREQILPLERPETVIGRKGDVDILLPNQHVSRHHARIVKTGQGFDIVDNSTHGTFVNERQVKQHSLQHGDLIRLGKDRVELYYFTREGNISRQTQVVPSPPLSDLSIAVTPGASELEKIAIVLDFQYQWEQAFTPERAFAQILESSLKISGTERGFILVRTDEGFEYATGIDGRGRALPQSEFQKASQTFVKEVQNSKRPVFNIEGIEERFKDQQSIVSAGLRAIACLPLLGIPATGDAPILLGILYLDSTKRMHHLSGFDQKILSRLAVEAGQVLQRVELIKASDERKRLERELALAEETQRNLLPLVLPSLEGFEIRAFSKPTRYVGGDFYDFIPTGPHRVLGVLADVSGKGVSASLLSSTLLGCLQMQVRLGVEPEEAIGHLNKFLCEKTSSSRFVTMFCFEIDSNGTGRYVSAGHNPAYVFRAASGTLEEIHSNNLIAGAFDFAQYESAPLHLSNGDLLFVYSDGLTDAENPDGQPFGEERLKEFILAEAGNRDAKILEAKLLTIIQAFTKGRAQVDDITIVIVRKV